MTANVKSGQSLLDIAVQHGGSVEAVAAIALAADVPLHHIPVAGSALATAVADETVADYFLKNGHTVATAYDN